MTCSVPFAAVQCRSFPAPIGSRVCHHQKKVSSGLLDATPIASATTKKLDGSWMAVRGYSLVSRNKGEVVQHQIEKLIFSSRPRRWMLAGALLIIMLLIGLTVGLP